MKKYLLIIAIVCMAGGYAQAQFRFGVKAGMNFSSFSTDTENLKQNYNGFQFGIVPQFKIPVIGLGLQPELLYTVNSGEKLSDYFTVPVNIRWQLLPLPLVKPVILAGPYFGYAVNIKNGANITPRDWGLGFGAGIEIWKFQIEGRYSFGFTNISDANNSVKNRKFSLSAVYFF